GKQTTVGSGGFFVCKQQITRRKKGSQEDPLIFSTEPSKKPPGVVVFSFLVPKLTTKLMISRKN
ncbi:hypothetical protein MRT09_25115, partial [Escherichia coli]|nr:hypothetical protein [Escherichia coli]